MTARRPSDIVLSSQKGRLEFLPRPLAASKWQTKLLCQMQRSHGAYSPDARSVVAALTARGIAARRLRAEGYGQEKPITDNGTSEGRAQNRRVELGQN